MKSTIKKYIFIQMILAMGIVHTATAKITLPSFFTNHMVLQQKSTIPFWGQGTAGSRLKVFTSWDNKIYNVSVDANQSWIVDLKTPVYGGPYTITIENGDTVTLTDILIGEVWLCSGQSNMEMPVQGWGKINDYEMESKNANYPQIRLIQAEHVDSAKPLNDLKVQYNGWQVCNPETIKDFSATAYFFARKIYTEKHIPIGLIHSSWGGSNIEAWTSSEALNKIHDFDQELQSLQSETDRQALQQKFDLATKAWNVQLEKADKGMQQGKPLWSTDQANDVNWKNMTLPVFWENSGLDDFDGVVWFRKTITVPETMLGNAVQLQFYADDDDTVWVNGVAIGATVGYNVYRNYTIPANVLKKGDNNITIRIFDGSSGGGIYGNPDDMFLLANGKKLSLAGDWKYAIGAGLADLPSRPYVPQGQNRPASLYNAMIHPLLKYKLAGIIWYQGENNAERAHQYQTLFPLLINDWRKQFQDNKLPFYYVQLANYKKAKQQPLPSSWAELREAQFKTLDLPYTGMAVITDIGEAADIHPKNKQDVGDRLARIALAKTYGVDIPYSGPLYQSYTKATNAITISFKHAQKICAKGNTALKGFAIAGADKIFYWATAKIEGDKVVVSSPKVKDPIAVRYNWADNPDGNLTNGSGLPASPFRTDNWEGITFGRK